MLNKGIPCSTKSFAQAIHVRNEREAFGRNHKQLSGFLNRLEGDVLHCRKITLRSLSQGGGWEKRESTAWKTGPR